MLTQEKQEKVEAFWKANPPIKNCQRGCKITLQACHKRQLKTKRYFQVRSNGAPYLVLSPEHRGCYGCENFLSDNDYNENRHWKTTVNRGFTSPASPWGLIG